MNCAIIGTYLPRQCGIATFTNDIYNSLMPDKLAGDDNAFVVAINDRDQQYNYPEEVTFKIREKHFQDYSDAAMYINQHADICLLQHEYNIFGGDDGVYILSLLNKLKIPLVSTLHTVLKKPSVSEHYTLREICNLSQNIVVLSQVAADILSSVYGIHQDKISMIRHGVPDIRLNPLKSKKKLNLSGKKVLLTFGLINRNKGIETVINALPQVVHKYPDIRYLVVGKTHPVIQRLFGEEYRQYLEKLVTDLGLQQIVRFENRFVDASELNLYMSATDILITPYLSEAQVSSGPLSFAMGAGAALISTPFWHARELLADDRGRLFKFRDYEGLSSILLEMFDDPELLKRLRQNAANFGQEILWPIVGQDYIALLKSEVEKFKKVTESPPVAETKTYPKVSFRHIRKLTDSTGIISHAVFGFPNLKNGYRLEDNSRALYATTMAYRQSHKIFLKSLMTTYLSFIQFMQNSDGTFKHQLMYNRERKDENGSDECFGTVLWALGCLINNPPDYGFLEGAKDIFKKALTITEKICQIRGMAYSIIGLCHYLETYKIDQITSERLYSLLDKLIAFYRTNKKDNWKWFEPKISYDNAVLPLALMSAGELMQDEKSKIIAFESMRFLTDIVIIDGQLSLIGNKKWYKKDGERSVFDQLPVDAMGLILLYKKAFELTKNQRFYQLMQICFNWFFGKNDLHVPLYESNTKGCYDGLQEKGVNRNQGAESSLAFVISNMAVQEITQQIPQSLGESQVVT